MTTRSGSGPVQVTRSCPQLHEAVRVLMADPCPELESAARAIVVATPARAATAMTSRLEYLVVMLSLHRLLSAFDRIHFTSSTSPGRHVLSNHGSSGL